MVTIAANMFFQSMHDHKSQQRRLRSMRDFLLSSLHINPHSQNLVVALGHGTERNNSDALLSWLSGAAQQGSCLADLPPGDIESLLLRHLHRTLDCWPD